MGTERRSFAARPPDLTAWRTRIAATSLSATRALYASCPLCAPCPLCVPCLLCVACLLWPALWNFYPIVFADTGTYLYQAMHRSMGWDRPPFYSLFIYPFHQGVMLWPVVVVQAVLAVLVLNQTRRAFGLSPAWLLALVAFLSGATWFPWIVSELMPDLFTPLLVLLLSLLVFTPARFPAWERAAMTALAAFMIATQQSSVLLSVALLGFALPLERVFARRVQASSPDKLLRQRSTVMRERDAAKKISPQRHKDTKRHWWFHGPRFPLCLCVFVVIFAFSPVARHCASLTRWLRYRLRSAAAGMTPLLAPVLGIAALVLVNAIGHGRITLSPYGNVFLLARVIYDGPGMGVLRRDCPEAGWRLCAYLDRFPPSSDDFLWRPDSPVMLAGGHKAVSAEADAIIRAALRAAPAEALRAAWRNAAEQLTRFESGDGLEPWPFQVGTLIERDFPPLEQAAYHRARQQRDALEIPAPLADAHRAVALGGIVLALALMPLAWRRRHPAALFLAVALLTLPVSAAITGALSTPHDRYQSRVVWLPACLAFLTVPALFQVQGRRPFPGFTPGRDGRMTGNHPMPPS